MHTSQVPGLLRQDLLFFFKLGEDAFNWRNNGGCVYLEVPKQLRPRENCQRQCSASGRTKHGTYRTQVESTNDKLRSFVIPVFILCPVSWALFPIQFNIMSLCYFGSLFFCKWFITRRARHIQGLTVFRMLSSFELFCC